MASIQALADAKRAVAPATLVSSTLYHDLGYTVNQLEYAVPIDHRGTDDEASITITVRVVLGRLASGTDSSGTAGAQQQQGEAGSARHAAPRVHVKPDTPIAVYLVGGPGSDNPPTAHPALNDFYLGKGFQVLYMDYRGTGSSHALRADRLSALLGGADDSSARLAALDPQAQADLLMRFRQDNIVRDLEAVRRSLLQDAGIAAARAWTLVGQSYGGWVSYTYLSLYPAALSMVLLTGGVPPVGRSAQAVYARTYATVVRACDAFYAKYPQHEDTVRMLVAFLAAATRRDGPYPGGVPMPGGGCLTPERFLCLGRTLGTTGGNDKVAAALDACRADVVRGNALSIGTLAQIEGWLRFEERPLYAVLQEPIYMEPGVPAANWAAESVGRQLRSGGGGDGGDGGSQRRCYDWLPEQPAEPGRPVWSADVADSKRRIYLSAEHVYRFHFDQFQALRPLRQAADRLARTPGNGWPVLYDAAQLRRNTVPVAALSYRRDMFVDWGLSEATLQRTGTAAFAVSSRLMHTAVKDAPDEVLPWLWRLLGEAVAKAAGRASLTPAESQNAASLLALLP